MEMPTCPKALTTQNNVSYPKKKVTLRIFSIQCEERYKINYVPNMKALAQVLMTENANLPLNYNQTPTNADTSSKALIILRISS